MAINFGADNIKEIYIGNEPIKEVYCGSDKVWSKETPGGFMFTKLPEPDVLPGRSISSVALSQDQFRGAYGIAENYSPSVFLYNIDKNTLAFTKLTTPGTAANARGHITIDSVGHRVEARGGGNDTPTNQATRLLIATNGSVSVNPINLANVPTGNQNSMSTHFSPDNNWLFSSYYHWGTKKFFINVYTGIIDTPSYVTAITSQGSIYSMDTNNDATLLLVPEDGNLALYTRTGNTFIRVADNLLGTKVRIDRVKFSPDLEYIAAARSDGVKILKRNGSASYTEINNAIPDIDYSCNAIAWTQDGKELFIGSFMSALHSAPLRVYQRDGDSFTNITETAIDILPSGFGIYGISYSKDHNLLSLATTNSAIGIINYKNTIGG